MKTWIAFCCLLLAGNLSASTLINGAGATFPFPLYSKWFSDYNKSHPDVQINYQSIGSGGGIRQFGQRTVDFGASDAPMTDAQLADLKEPVLHVPTVLGAVVASYNLPEVKERLVLSGEVLADIFLGKITKWNDPALVALNPKAGLPEKPILVVHRSDGSGTTNIFTEYLSKVSPGWKSKTGTGTAVKWPVGLGGKGNEGVAGLMKQTPGSIGYLEMIYAMKGGLSVAAVKNKSGAAVFPDTASITAAASGVAVPADFRVSLTDAPGKAAYPISGFTYILVWKKPSDAAKGKQFTEFLNWALTEGQGGVAALHYAPLPKNWSSAVLKAVNAGAGTAPNSGT